MIIEGAFLKLPELLLGHLSQHEQYEATLVNHLAMAVLLELSSRNIQLPMHRIHLEKPYPKDVRGPVRGRADLFVNLAGVFGQGLGHHLYGMKNDNWVEAKFFASIGRQRGTEAKTEHVANLVLDLCRLCFLVTEGRTKVRENGRYLVLVFNKPPSQYLPFSTRSSGQEARDWLTKLLCPGIQQIRIDLKSETQSFKRIIGLEFLESMSVFRLALKVVTSVFAPIEAMYNDLYWGYLIRIVDFQVTFGEDTLTYTDTSTDFWTKEQVLMQERLTQGFLRQSL